MRGVPFTVTIESGTSATKVINTASAVGDLIVYVQGVIVTPNGSVASVGRLSLRQGNTVKPILTVRTPADKSVSFEVPLTIIVPSGHELIAEVAGGVGASMTVAVTL